MAATLYYLDALPAVGEVAVLDGPEGRHAATVRRTTVGERLVLADGHGEVASVVVTRVGQGRLEAEVYARSRYSPPEPRVTLVQALPKSERSELAVETATEAGVDAVVPWQSKRCVARWDGPKAVKGVAKWRAAAVSAAKQSRRPIVPEVATLHDTRAVLALVTEVVGRGGTVLALHESATAPLSSMQLRTCSEVVLIVGPEGGLDDGELDGLVRAGAHSVVLGPTVLRTSTAASVALGALGVLTNRWSEPPLH